MKAGKSVPFATTAIVAGILGFLLGSLVEFKKGESDQPDSGGGAGVMGSGTDLAGAAPATGESGPPPRSGNTPRPPASVEAEPDRQVGRESLHRMLEQPGPISRWQDLMDFARTASPDEISGAIDELILLPNSIDTVVARFFLYSRFGEGDPEAALAAIEGLPPGEIDLAKQSVLGGWASQDPKAAAAHLLELADSNGELNGLEGRLVRNVTAEWARRNPSEAFGWALDLKGEGRQTGIDTVLRIWASRAPEEAADAISGFPAGEEREKAYRSLSEHWSQADPSAVLDWSGTLSGKVKAIATATAVGNLAKSDPRLAAERIGNLEPGVDRDRAVASTVHHWAKTDPLEAAEWAWPQPDSEGKRKAVRDVVRQWAREDERAASQWLDRQPPGLAKDSGIVALSNNVVADDPEAAAIWANSIGDSALRALQVRGVIRNWSQSDRGAAMTWLQKANVPDSVKAEFFQR